METSRERRAHKRVTNRFRIGYPSRRRDERGLFASGWEMVTARNFSAGGALFDYDKEIKKGSFLDLKIDLPGNDKMVDCVGHVMRIEKPKESSTYCIAVLFVDMDEEARKKTDSLVKELLPEDGTYS